jgi:hypothetical protein
MPVESIIEVAYDPERRSFYEVVRASDEVRLQNSPFPLYAIRRSRGLAAYDLCCISKGLDKLSLRMYHRVMRVLRYVKETSEKPEVFS